MAEPSLSQQLRQIAHEMRSTVESCRSYLGSDTSPGFEFRVLEIGGKLLDRALALGAFGDPKYVALRHVLDKQKQIDPDRWCESTFAFASYWLLPEVEVDWQHGVIVSFADVFDRWAELIEREAKSLENGRDTSATDPPLGERAQLVLKVLNAGGAFDSDHRMVTADIAVKAIGKGADANQFKEVIVELKKLGYVDTQRGRSGGCWLTASGRTRAEKLEKGRKR